MNPQDWTQATLPTSSNSNVRALQADNLPSRPPFYLLLDPQFPFPNFSPQLPSPYVFPTTSTKTSHGFIPQLPSPISPIPFRFFTSSMQVPLPSQTFTDGFNNYHIIPAYLLAPLPPNPTSTSSPAPPHSLPNPTTTSSPSSSNTSSSLHALVPANYVSNDPPLATRRRRSYSNKKKFKVIQLAKKGKAKEARELYGVTSGMISKWRKQEETIRKAPRNRRTLHKGRASALTPEQENQVLEEVAALRRIGLPVSGDVIAFAAKRVAQSDPKLKDFKASSGFVTRFKRRHGLVNRKGTKKALVKIPTNALDVLRDWHRELHAKLAGRRYVINMDETPIFFNLTGDYTLEKKGSKEVLIKTDVAEKKRVTVVLGIIRPLEGAPEKVYKCKPMLIVKGETRRVVNSMNILAGERDCVVRFDAKAWCNEALCKEWVKKCIPAGVAESALLVWDNFAAHVTEGTLRACAAEKLTVLTLPPNCTPYIQPLDVAINRPFKTLMRQKYRAWAVENPKKQLTNRNIYDFLVEAWKEISETSILNAFRTCGFGQAPESLTPANTYWLRLPSLFTAQANASDDSSGELECDVQEERIGGGPEDDGDDGGPQLPTGPLVQTTLDSFFSLRRHSPAFVLDKQTPN